MSLSSWTFLFFLGTLSCDKNSIRFYNLINILLPNLLINLPTRSVIFDLLGHISVGTDLFSPKDS